MLHVTDFFFSLPSFLPFRSSIAQARRTHKSIPVISGPVPTPLVSVSPIVGCWPSRERRSVYLNLTGVPNPPFTVAFSGNTATISEHLQTQEPSTGPPQSLTQRVRFRRPSLS